eukprot:393525-Rhodomonas_salina.1
MVTMPSWGVCDSLVAPSHPRLVGNTSRLPKCTQLSPLARYTSPVANDMKSMPSPRYTSNVSSPSMLPDSCA